MAYNKKKGSAQGKGRNNQNDKRASRNGKRTGDSGYSKRDDRFEEDAHKGNTKASNDPSWWSASSMLMQQAANLPFFETAGLKYDLSNSDLALVPNSDLTSLPTDCVNPGIMQLYLMPLPGMCEDWSAPVNVAVRDAYAFIRQHNSGAKNYDAANLGMYLMAYDSALTYYAWMVRIYGLLRLTILRNRYTPEVLLESAGLNYASFVSNMAQFCAYINTYAARLNVLKVPSDFTLFKRHMWLYQNLFVDAPVEKAQMYMFNPHRFWKFKLGETPDTTGLFPTYPGDIWNLNGENTGHYYANYDDVTDFGDIILNSVLNSEDFNMMSGDIMKAYGDKVYSLAMISPDYRVTPVYDPEVLVQIHNATVLGGVSGRDGTLISYDDWKIVENYTESEDVGIIEVHAPMNHGRVSMYPFMNKILDLPVQDPNPALVCMATRMMVHAEVDPNVDDNTGVYLTVYGTEVVADAQIVRKGGTTAGFETRDLNDFNDEFNRACFANRPFVIPQKYDDSEGVMIYNALTGPMDNYTVVDKHTLRNIHRAALLGIYGFVK